MSTKSEWSVILFIAAELEVGNKRYVGVDLWNIFQRLCGIHNVEVTMTEEQFTSRLTDAQDDMTYDKASAAIRGFLFFLNFAEKAITA